MVGRQARHIGAGGSSSQGLWCDWVVGFVEAVQKWKTDGFVVLPSYLSANQLSSAIAELRLMFPSADEFHRQPDAEDYARFNDEFGGIDDFPFRSTELSLLSVHQDIVDLAKTLLGTEHLRVYSIEAWRSTRVRRTSTSTITVTISVTRWSSLRSILAFSKWRCSSTSLTFPSISARRRSSPAAIHKICLRYRTGFPATTMLALTKNTQNGSLSRADQIFMNMKYRLPDLWELLWPMPMTRSIEAPPSRSSEALVTPFM